MALQDKKGKWITGSLAKAASDEEYKLIMSTVPQSKDASTLAAFGYQYIMDEKVGKTVLRTIQDPSKGFFWLGQKHYDILGNAIVNEIYSQLNAKYGLQKVMVPLSDESEATQKEPSLSNGGAPTDEVAEPSASSATNSAGKRPTRSEPQVPIFVSEDATTTDTLLLVMQGSGAVRPGMWARALCMNESLESGSIYSYLDKAKERGWGIIVTNPNENTVLNTDLAAASDDGKSTVEEFWLGTPDSEWKAFARKVSNSSERVRGSESPQEHSQYVYNTFVIPSKAKKIFIVAHSFGGMCTGALFRNPTIRAHLLEKCVAVAFTDAINDIKASDAPEIKEFYNKKVINWVASKRPLNAPEGTHRPTGSIECSAGHDTHEWTSACCVVPVFAWFDRLNAIK